VDASGDGVVDVVDGRFVIVDAPFYVVFGGFYFRLRNFPKFD
jgi:hypothetical protein